LLQFSEARDLHIQQAELATMAFLERNPKDFDNPDLLKLMFLKPALAKAQDERVKEMAEFRANGCAGTKNLFAEHLRDGVILRQLGIHLDDAQGGRLGSWLQILWLRIHFVLSI
jgi:hypothetical protein